MKGTVAGGSPSPDARARVPAPRAVMGTPPVTPLADNRVMLSKTARRLSYFSERYAAMGGMRNNLAEDASSPAAAAPRRSSALSPILPTLNRRAIAGGGPHGTDDHGPTLSPLHAGTVVRDETAAVDPVSRVAERVRRSAVPPMTPPPTRYVAAAFSKENRNNVPNEGGMLSSVRSMWTGDSKMSIRESLKSALDVHTPPPNSVARIRRSSAMLPSQGAAASIVAAAQMRPPQTAGVGRRKTMLSGMSSTNTRRVSTAPTSSGEGQHRDKLNSSYVRNNNMGGGGSIGVGGSGRAGRDSTTLPALRNRLGRNSSKGGGGY